MKLPAGTIRVPLALPVGLPDRRGWVQFCYRPKPDGWEFQLKKTCALLITGLLLAGLPAGQASELPTNMNERVPSGIVRHRFAMEEEDVRSSGLGANERRSKPAAGRSIASRERASSSVRSPGGAAREVPMAPPQRVHQSGQVIGTAASAAFGPIPYTRLPVQGDYRSFPTSTNGKIFVTFPEGTRSCSGTVVSSGPDNPRGVVFTAAQCVYQSSLGGWAKKVIFVPAFSGNRPFGEWTASEAFVADEWVDGGENLHFDVAVLYIPPRSNGETLEKDNTGGMGLVWNQSPEIRPIESFAYPSGGEFGGQRLFACRTETRVDFPQPEGPGPPTLAIGCDLPQEGTAGGGWIIHDPIRDDLYLSSIFSYKVADEKEVSFGPYFGSEVAQLYEAAAAGDRVTHRMKITLKLKGHLKATGRITARDGYAPCGNNAPIRIQRHKRGRWTTVRTTRSKGTGKYSVRIADRPGLYRAFSPAGAVNDLNLCSAAKSRPKRN